MAAQGGLCAICKVAEKDTPQGYLEIDHIDDDKNNNVFANFQLLCTRDNMTKENKRRAGLKWPALLDGHGNGHQNGNGHRPVTQLTSEREGERKVDGWVTGREAVDYQRGSVEMQANDWYEPSVISYVTKRIEREGESDYVDTVNAAAEYAGCNPSTAKRYLDKKTSSIGAFEIIKSPNTKRRMLRFRDALSVLANPANVDGVLPTVLTGYEPGKSGNGADRRGRPGRDERQGHG